MLPRNSCSSRSGNEARATAYAESLTELLESLEPDLIQGRDVSVLTEMLDAAAARSFTELAARPDVQADVQHTLGTVYMDLSMFDKAEIMLESAVAIRRDLAPKGDLHLGQALASLGFMHLSTGQGKTAEPYMREAVTMLRAVHDPPAPVSNLAEAEAALSQCLGADATPANLLEVLTLSRQALERCEQNLDVVPHDTFTYCILVRAEAMWVTNDLDKAEAMYRYLLEVRRSFDSEESQGVASAHVVLGRLLKQRGKL
ncbi:MAG: tetratricopeptide repeat protein, partial [Phycisphaerales bacterium]